MNLRPPEKIVEDIENNVGLYLVHGIVDHQQEYIAECELAKKRFDAMFPNESTTRNYANYNIFALTSGSLWFYILLNNLNTVVRSFLSTSEPLWFQSWLNVHSLNTVLDWHDHSGCIAHGYVSIDPKDTVTEFDAYKIVNKPGVLYIGAPNKRHRVIVNKAFTGPRYTIAFDVYDSSVLKQNNRGAQNFSIFPLPN